MNTHPLLQAVEICGTQEALAAAINKKQGTVSAWINRFDCKVTPELVIEVSRATNWKVTPHSLRPDLYPNPNDALPFEILNN